MLRSLLTWIILWLYRNLPGRSSNSTASIIMAKKTATSCLQKNVFWDCEDFWIIFVLKSLFATCPNLLRKKSFPMGWKRNCWEIGLHQKRGMARKKSNIGCSAGTNWVVSCEETVSLRYWDKAAHKWLEIWMWPNTSLLIQSFSSPSLEFTQRFIDYGIRSYQFAAAS